MDDPSSPSEPPSMERWRPAWEQEMAARPPHLRRPFPNQSLYNSANEARKVVHLLAQHGIPCCITGVQALCYYGAPRLCAALEFCVPTEQLAAANDIFSTGPVNASYLAWRGRHPELEGRAGQSLYHTFPRFRLNHDGPLFDFQLVPSCDWRFECIQANFEYSAQKQLPYPKLHLFAQSLLERQDLNDLQDLVDGMNLTEEWGDENLRFGDHGAEYTRWLVEKNAKIRDALPQEVKDEVLDGMLGTEIYELDEEPPDFRETFTLLTKTKEGRIGLETPTELYATKYRAKGSPDPRTRIRFHV